MPISESLRNTKARFLNCELHCNSGHLFIDDKEINLEPMIFQFLLLLIEHQGQIVPKNEVLIKLWEDKKPTDEALRALVKKTREVLGDNARNPIFIKTIPTKGYLLIPSVEIRSTVTQSWAQQNRKYIVVVGLVVTLLIAISIYWYASTYVLNEKEELNISLNTKLIADIKGDVNAYYTDKGILNIVSNDNKLEAKNSLLIQNLNSREQIILSFDEPISGDVWLASSLEYLLVMRKENAGFYHVNLSSNWRNVAVFKFDFPLPSNERIVGINHTANLVYLFNNSDFTVSQFDIDSGEQIRPPAFEALSSILQDLRSQQVSHTDQSRDKQSNLKNFNLDVRIVTAQKNQIMTIWVENSASDVNHDTTLYFFDSLESTDPIDKVELDDTVLTDIVWDGQGSRLSFLNENGALFSYQLAQKNLTSWRLGGTKLNNLLADCGRDCFVTAKKQGIPKLVNTQLNFIVDNELVHSNKKHAVVTKSDTSSRLEILPFYSKTGLYFLTADEATEDKNSTSFSIIKRDQNGIEKVIFTFPSNSDVQEFTINENETMLLGVVNQRPILLDIDTQSLQYLNLKSPNVSHLNFVSEDIINFSSEQSHQALSTESINSSNFNRQMAVYTYNLKNKMVNKVADNSIIFESVTLNDISNDEPHRFTGNLKITQNFKATVSFGNQNDFRELGKVDSNCIRCFQIIDNDFYYLGRNLVDAVSYSLIKIDMISGQTSTMPLPKTFHSGEFLMQFSIDPETHELTLVQRQNLQTDLTQLTGMRQIF